MVVLLAGPAESFCLSLVFFIFGGGWWAILFHRFLTSAVRTYGLAC